MERYEQIKRLEEFDHLREEYLNNNIVNRVVMDYASGNILTREEAYSLMVKHLCMDWTTEMERAKRDFITILQMKEVVQNATH